MSRGSSSSDRNAQVDRLFSEGQARFVSFKSNTRVFDEELKRFWPVERDNLIDTIYAHMQGINTVTNPQVDPNIQFPGIWRVVEVEKVSNHNEAPFDGIPGILQTLRYGYDASTTVATLPWSTGRIINLKQADGNASAVPVVADTTSDDPDAFMLIEFKNLDPATAPALAKAIAGTATFSNFVIRGVTYAQTYHTISTVVLESEHPGDGSARIQVLLAQPQYTLRAFREYFRLYNNARQSAVVFYLWAVPKNLAQTIIDTFEATGRSVSADYSLDNSLVNLTLVDSLHFYGMYSGNLSQGGTCSFIDTVQFFWGIYDPTSNLYDPAHFTDFQDPGVTYTRRIELDRDTGLWNITISRSEAQTRRYAPFVSTLAGTLYKTDYLELAVKDDTYLGLPGESVQGVIYDQNIKPNPDCSKDVVTTWTTSKEKSWYVEMYSESGTRGFWWFMNQRTLPNPTSFLDPTYQNSFTSSLNADDTYDVNVVSGCDPWTYGAILSRDGFYYVESVLATYESEKSESEENKTYKNSQVAYPVYYVHRVDYHNSEEAAYTAGFGALNNSLNVRFEGGKWRSDAIVRIQYGAPFETVNATNFYLPNYGTSPTTLPVITASPT